MPGQKRHLNISAAIPSQPCFPPAVNLLSPPPDEAIGLVSDIWDNSAAVAVPTDCGGGLLSECLRTSSARARALVCGLNAGAFVMLCGGLCGHPWIVQGLAEETTDYVPITLAFTFRDISMSTSSRIYSERIK